MTLTLDAEYSGMSQVSFMDGLPTIDDGFGFYISQFAKLESKIYEAKYTHINFAELIPVDTSYPEWADSWDYISYDGVTMGKFIGSSADDLPNISLRAHKTSVPIGYAGNSYDYSLDELRKSQQIRLPLDTTKAKLAYRGAMEHMQRVAYFGDAERNMNGLFNNPNIAVDNSTVDWATADGQAIIDDMNGLFIEVWNNSANVHIPNTLVLPSTKFALISSKRMDSGTDTTILEWFKKNNLYTSLTGKEPKVTSRLQLNNAGAGEVERMMAYELNSENLGLVNPMPFRPLAPQPVGLVIKVPCEYKMSGTEIRYPFSAAYRDFA